MNEFFIYLFTFTAGMGFIMVIIDVATKITEGETRGGFNISIPLFIGSIVFILLWKFVF